MRLVGGLNTYGSVGLISRKVAGMRMRLVRNSSHLRQRGPMNESKCRLLLPLALPRKVATHCPCSLLLT